MDLDWKLSNARIVLSCGQIHDVRAVELSNKLQLPPAALELINIKSTTIFCPNGDCGKDVGASNVFRFFKEAQAGNSSTASILRAKFANLQEMQLLLETAVT